MKKFPIILFLLFIMIQEMSADPVYFRSVTLSYFDWSTYLYGKENPLQSKNKIMEKVITHVTLTTYNPVASQCDEEPLVTANNTKIDIEKVKSGKQRIVAISRDLLYLIPMGSEVHIEGYGRYIVADVMNKRFTHRMDILQTPDKENFKKDKIKVTLIRGKVN